MSFDLIAHKQGSRHNREVKQDARSRYCVVDPAPCAVLHSPDGPAGKMSPPGYYIRVTDFLELPMLPLFIRGNRIIRWFGEITNKYLGFVLFNHFRR